MSRNRKSPLPDLDPTKVEDVYAHRLWSVLMKFDSNGDGKFKLEDFKPLDLNNDNELTAEEQLTKGNQLRLSPEETETYLGMVPILLRLIKENKINPEAPLTFEVVRQLSNEVVYSKVDIQNQLKEYKDQAADFKWYTNERATLLQQAHDFEKATKRVDSNGDGQITLGELMVNNNNLPNLKPDPKKITIA